MAQDLFKAVDLDHQVLAIAGAQDFIHATNTNSISRMHATLNNM